jgi:hypothetical protein
MCCVGRSGKSAVSLGDGRLQESEPLKSSYTPTLANKSGGEVPVNYEFWGGSFIELHIVECVYVSCVFAVCL